MSPLPGTAGPLPSGDCTRPDACCNASAPLAETECAEIAALFKALAHPVRVSIVAALARCPGACCGEIVSSLPLAQSTVSQHLAVLRDADLVTVRDEGRSCRYQLSPATAARLHLAGLQLLPRTFVTDAVSPSDRTGSTGPSRKAKA